MDIVISLELTLLVAGLSVLSGVGSYLQGVRESRFKGGRIDLLTEITLALVVGLAVAYWGHYKQWHEALVCFTVLVLSNNGGDAIWKAKRFINRLIDQKLGINQNSNNGG